MWRLFGKCYSYVGDDSNKSCAIRRTKKKCYSWFATFIKNKGSRYRISNSRKVIEFEEKKWLWEKPTLFSYEVVSLFFFLESILEHNFKRRVELKALFCAVFPHKSHEF